MQNLQMTGPFRFGPQEINDVVIGGAIGNYTLGGKTLNGHFVVQYVGRSNVDLRQRLLSHFYSGERYECFMYSYARSIREAYEKECRNYHDFGGPEGFLDNTDHPAKPEGTNWICPVCGK